MKIQLQEMRVYQFVIRRVILTPHCLIRNVAAEISADDWDSGAASARRRARREAVATAGLVSTAACMKPRADPLYGLPDDLGGGRQGPIEAPQ